jgi:hypothetical protein
MQALDMSETHITGQLPLYDVIDRFRLGGEYGALNKTESHIRRFLTLRRRDLLEIFLRSFIQFDCQYHLFISPQKVELNIPFRPPKSAADSFQGLPRKPLSAAF